MVLNRFEHGQGKDSVVMDMGKLGPTSNYRNAFILSIL